MRHKLIVMSAAFLLLSASAVIATERFVFDVNVNVLSEIERFIGNHSRMGFADWYASALVCEKPGEMIYQKPGKSDDIGTLCSTEGKVHVVNAGVNYGLIERFKGAGVPVDWLRVQLSKPEVLKAVYDLIGPTFVHELVKLSLTGEYAIDFVYAEDEDDPGIQDFTKLDEHAIEYLAGFILRRTLEAEPRDRKEIGRIWGMIIQEQMSYLLADPLLVPDFLRPKETRKAFQ